MPSLNSRDIVARSVLDLLSHSPRNSRLTIIIERGKSGDYSVSTATIELLDGTPTPSYCLERLSIYGDPLV